MAKYWLKIKVEDDRKKRQTTYEIRHTKRLPIFILLYMIDELQRYREEWREEGVLGVEMPPQKSNKPI